MATKLNSQSKPQNKFTLLETLFISISIFALLFGVVTGIVGQSRVNDDKVRIRNIKSMIKVLDQYYNDSSSVEFSRRYPISQCSSTEPNAIDFEHTLYLTLTGQESNSFKYLEPSMYPQDAKASFISQSKQSCLDKVDTTKYSFNNKQCQYDTAQGKNFCYLYSSSNTGDKFTLSFFSDSKNKMISVSQLRSSPPSSEGLDIAKEVLK
jgi:type II secretory pathway pseudopilin PulG